MTREEIIKGLGEISVCQIWEDEVIDEAIKALEQEPCEDAISRQATLNLNLRELVELRMIISMCMELAEEKTKEFKHE